MYNNNNNKDILLPLMASNNDNKNIDLEKVNVGSINTNNDNDNDNKDNGKYKNVDNNNNNNINEIRETTLTRTYNEFSDIFSVRGKKGTYLQYILMIVGMIASIIANIYTRDSDFFNVWLEGCPEDLEQKCLSSQVLFRFSFALVCIFTINLIGTTIAIDFYDKHWALKYLSFVGCIVGFYYASPAVFDLHGYAWFARIAAFFFLLLQQIILLDFAYTWNEKWVAKAQDDPENGNKYLIGLLVAAFFLFVISIIGIVVMYHYFQKCTSNIVIISLTLFFGFLATIFQLFFTDHGSILTSSIIVAYCTYICYSAISLNPDEECNPTLSTGYQNFSVVVGMTLTIVSVSWATSSTISKVPGASLNVQDSPDVMNLRTVLQEVSVVFILASAYYAMVLTNWYYYQYYQYYQSIIIIIIITIRATLKSSQISADPRTGTDSMAIQASALFLCLALYIWSLVAPKLFPDRDFSSY